MGQKAMAQKIDIDNILDKVVLRIRDNYDPDRIVLYGSYAYGSPDEGSDVDLLIVKDTPERPIERRIAVRKMISDVRRKIPFSSLVVTPGELSERVSMGDDFWVEITTRGKVLYERP